MDKILLNSKRGKRTTNKDNMLSVQLYGKQRILPYTSYIGTINSYDVYQKERKTNNINLKFNINVVASNVLFNNISEITYEDSNGIKLLNNGAVSVNKNTLTIDGDKYTLMGNDKENPSLYDAIRDTQYSNFDNFNYMCGRDIYNNHLLRSQTFKCVNPPSSTSGKEFNTIADWLRDEYGNIVTGDSDDGRKQLHLYIDDDVVDFTTSMNDGLIENNGWFGFNNNNKINTLSGDTFTINKVINSKNNCDFIELYPDSTLFTFSPKFNEKLNRIEKNWNYQLTYPSHHIYECEYINSITHGLKLIYSGDTKNSNGVECAVFYTYCNNNLKKDDKVNIYKDGNLLIKGALVVSIGNYDGSESKYIFSLNYEEIEGISDSDLNEGLSLKRVDLNNECDYYMRMFSIIPNFSFTKEKIDETNINANIINYQDYPFSNDVSNFGFSKNIFNDNIGQLVYLDKINLDYLTDNLGRPLSEIYLTIIKNNKGFRKWYGINETQDLNDNTIEYSHCFGKVTCGFDSFGNMKKGQSSYENEFWKIPYVRNLHNIKPENSTNSNAIPYPNNPVTIDKFDEISEKGICINDNGNEEYYKHPIYGYCFPGDIVEFSVSSFQEVLLEDAMFRFNTAQRELNIDNNNINGFSSVKYDEIVRDDFDQNGFMVSAFTYSSAGTSSRIGRANSTEPPVCQRPEGYFYKAHNKIQIHTFGDVQYDYSILIDNIDSKEINNTTNECIVKTNKIYYPSIGCKMYAIDKTTKKVVAGEIISIENLYNFIIKFEDKVDKNGAFILRKQNFSIPNYAKQTLDGTGRFMWRDIVYNGFGDDNEVYPFTNDALYIEKYINLYLKRQDPNGELKNLYQGTISNNGKSLNNENLYFTNPSGNRIPNNSINEYVKSINIVC